ncbi:MAG: hypothetical protein ACLR0U_19665 [Enterocloster clostridioformis]
MEEKLNYCRSSVFHFLQDLLDTELALIAAIDEDNSQTGLIDVLGDICKETKKILRCPLPSVSSQAARTWGD